MRGEITGEKAEWKQKVKPPPRQNTLSDFTPHGLLIGEMLNKSDAPLLRDYAAHGSEPAFGEIVTRHTDLIYSAALRPARPLLKA